MARLVALVLALGLPSPATAQTASLEDVRVALTIGAAPATSTYVVLDTFDSGSIAAPPLETRFGGSHYAITRPIDPVALSPGPGMRWPATGSC